MTVIVNIFWGGRVCQVVDRQISRKLGMRDHDVVDRESNKVLVVLTRDALVSIAYTGIAIADDVWMDCVIANCIAHRELSNALVQPGIPYLARPIHVVIDELALNLNGKLNSDKAARTHDLKISIVGFHLHGANKYLAWEITRGKKESNGIRYFKVTKHRVGKFLRAYPNGFWVETLGDPGDTIDQGIVALKETAGMNHDDIEVYVRDLIEKRSKETQTVSNECIAVQLDLATAEWHVQTTFYPSAVAPFLTPWVLTPRLVSAPSISSSSTSATSDCGRYAVSGFEDGNTKLSVQSRLPIEHREHDSGVIYFSFNERMITPSMKNDDPA